jgi:CRP/FNR family transcriptional regulator, cyclic AMP receptor protein
MGARSGRIRRVRGWSRSPSSGRIAIAPALLRERQAILSRVPLFAELPKRHIRDIARVTWVSEYPEGAVLCRQGAVDLGFYVIVEGRARVVSGSRTVARLTAGDFFGEISLLDPGPRTATVISETDIRCLQLTGSDFRGMLAKEPLLAARVATGLARRLRRVQRPIVE